MISRLGIHYIMLSNSGLGISKVPRLCASEHLVPSPLRPIRALMPCARTHSGRTRNDPIFFHHCGHQLHGRNIAASQGMGDRAGSVVSCWPVSSCQLGQERLCRVERRNSTILSLARISPTGVTLTHTQINHLWQDQVGHATHHLCVSANFPSPLARCVILITHS